MIVNKRISLNKIDMVFHFKGTMVSLLFFYFSIAPIINDFDYYSKYFSFEKILTPMLLLGLLTFIFLKERKLLFFEKYKLKLTSDNFAKALHITSNDLNWSTEKNSSNHFIGCRVPEDMFDGGGERIEIKRYSNYILINSVFEPHRKGFSFIGRSKSKKNIRTFLFVAYKISLGQDVVHELQKRKELKELSFWKKSESDFKTVMMRVTFYLLAVIFLILGLFLILEGAYPYGIILLALICYLIWTFSKADLTIIKKKKTENK